jgi:hypothetical protein
VLVVTSVDVADAHYTSTRTQLGVSDLSALRTLVSARMSM